MFMHAAPNPSDAGATSSESVQGIIIMGMRPVVTGMGGGEGQVDLGTLIGGRGAAPRIPIGKFLRCHN